MAKKPLPLRIDEGLLMRVDARCLVLGQTRTLFVERALESALEFEERLPVPPSVLRAADEASMRQGYVEGRFKAVEPAPSRGESRPAPKAVPTLKRGSAVSMDYRCPEPSCERVFGSAAAVCPSHGRKAVKA